MGNNLEVGLPAEVEEPLAVQAVGQHGWAKLLQHGPVQEDPRQIDDGLQEEGHADESVDAGQEDDVKAARDETGLDL